MLKLTRFTAPWCVPCKLMAPIFKELEKQFPDVIFETIDTEEFPEYTKLMKITTVPTVVVTLFDQEEKERIIGARTKKQLEEVINQHVSALSG
jgi:thiol-disulfide isomerase/thioredoxin